MPRTERLVASGLAIAAVTIMALAILVLVELDRESTLHRDVIAQIELNDELESLRTDLKALAHGARIAAITGTAESARSIQELSDVVERRLAEIAQRPKGQLHFAELAQSVRAMVLNARSIPRARAANGRGAGETLATESERLATEISLALDQTLNSQAARINRRSLDQIRTGESLRRYVAWSLAGAMILLAILFGLYRGAKGREREALKVIEHLAHHDTVTGLPNRALLNDRLERETARAARSERGYALLSFDLDGFKGVNDALGHAAGDVVLQVVARRARECMRASDTVGRLGGDEFLAILPEASLEGALNVAEKLRASLAEDYPTIPRGLRLSASIGVSLYPENGDDPEAVLRAADAALYDAKHQGRNRVGIASAKARTALEKAGAIAG
jgi:diguanylate cyclase (GGDEF)-like protein